MKPTKDDGQTGRRTDKRAENYRYPPIGFAGALKILYLFCSYIDSKCMYEIFKNDSFRCIVYENVSLLPKIPIFLIPYST